MSFSVHFRLRRSLAALCALFLVGGLITSAPAATAAVGVTCNPEQSVFAVNTYGTLYRYPFDDLSSTVTPVLAGPAKVVGSGWQQFGRVFGGPNGLVYGLKSGGLMEYRWAGSGFAGPPRNITTTFNGFASGANRTRITMDASGAVYAITGPGTDGLYRYIIDPVQGKIVNTQLMGSGWNKYNMIIGAGNGVIYSRDAAGVLYRTSFDPGSHRLIEDTKQVGGGWDQFNMIVSVGADILLAAQPDGDLLHYRYDETTGGWPISGRLIDTGWNQFTDLPAIVDDCKLNISHAPPAVAPQTEPGAPVAVRPNPNGQQIDYAYVNSNTGKVQWGHQRDVNVFETTTVVWPPMPSPTAGYVGVPSLMTFGTSQAAIIAQREDGQSWSAFQPSADTETLSPWRPEGGTMAGGASFLEDAYAWIHTPDPHVATPALHAVDGQGALWRSLRGANEFLESWYQLGAPGMVGSPVTTLWSAGMSLTVARTSSGGLVGWTDGHPSDFPYPPKQIDIGGSGLTGRIAMVNTSDGGARIFARDTTGAIMTTKVVWSSRGLGIDPWTKVGGDQFTFAGSPSAAVLADGTVVVSARTQDGHIYYSTTPPGETAFSTWELATSLPLTWTGDPTVFTYTNQSGPAWAITSYTVDYQVYAFTPHTNPPATPSAQATTKSATTASELTAHLIKP